jgi:hypothetical protein
MFRHQNPSKIMEWHIVEAHDATSGAMTYPPRYIWDRLQPRKSAARCWRDSRIFSARGTESWRCASKHAAAKSESTSGWPSRVPALPVLTKLGPQPP